MKESLAFRGILSFRLQISILFYYIGDARARFLRIQVVVTYDECLGIAAVQVLEECS